MSVLCWDKKKLTAVLKSHEMTVSKQDKSNQHQLINNRNKIIVTVSI